MNDIHTLENIEYIYYIQMYASVSYNLYCTMTSDNECTVY